MANDPKPLPYGQKLRIFSDGGSRGNPGPSAFCVLFMDENENQLYCQSEYLGEKTNNQAELLGILHGVQKAVSCTRGEIHIYSDSENAIFWLNGKYRVKHPNIKPLFDDIQKFLGGTRFTKVEFFHVPRKNQFIQLCDKEVNDCLDKNVGKKKNR